MTNIDEYAEMARVTGKLRQPVLRAAIQALELPPGSRGLDAGCGTGLQALMLAEAVGPAGHITGLDLSQAYLDIAQEMVKQSALPERISLRKGNVSELPFADNIFDWAWSADLVGYAPMEPLPLVKELARVVKPGGKLALLAWSSERLLPGYPDLEARLGATAAGIAPFVKGKKPPKHFARALGWLREAGLEGCSAHTFAGSAFAPLSADQRSALIALFEQRWQGVESELTREDGLEFQRLCSPQSPDFILDHPDYYAFFTYTMFVGCVPE